MAATTPPAGTQGAQLIPAPAQKTRQDFGGTEITTTGETASQALAVAARAAVEARFVMALQRPRDIEVVRVKMLAACQRPAFAEHALYSKPVGQKYNRKTGQWEDQFAVGLSIRFAEEAIRAFGNGMTEVTTLYEDDRKRIVRVSATDFETNVIHYKDISVDRTVEKKKLRGGQQPLGTRINSYNEQVFIVAATEDEMDKKVGANTSKALRDKILMLIPADLQEEARAMIEKTNATQDAKDPAAAKRKLVDAFVALGVLPNQIADFLGHDLNTIDATELASLRAIHAGIKDNETTWRDVMDQREETNANQKKPDGPQPVSDKPSIDAAVARAREKREAAKQPEEKATATPAASATVATQDQPNAEKKPEPLTRAQKVAALTALAKKARIPLPELAAKFEVAKVEDMTDEAIDEATAFLREIDA